MTTTEATMAAQAKAVGKAKGGAAKGVGRKGKCGVSKTPPKSDIGTLAKAKFTSPTCGRPTKTGAACRRFVGLDVTPTKDGWRLRWRPACCRHAS